MSERAEYTPSMDELRDEHSGVRHVSLGTMSAKDAEFDRAIAAHNQDLREKIARKIEARRNEPGQIELADRFGGYHAGQSDGLDLAASIARGEGSE